MGPVVCIGLAIGEHYSGKSFSWPWFVVIVEAAVIWQLTSELRKKPEPIEPPRLYLYYDGNLGGDGVFGYTGLFLRTEDGRVASGIRISSPETVNINHSRMRIRWTNPGQNVGTHPVPVLLRCVTVSKERESTITQIDGEQLKYWFERAKEMNRN